MLEVHSDEKERDEDQVRATDLEWITKLPTAPEPCGSDSGRPSSRVRRSETGPPVTINLLASSFNPVLGSTQKMSVRVRLTNRNASAMRSALKSDAREKPEPSARNNVANLPTRNWSRRSAV